MIALRVLLLVVAGQAEAAAFVGHDEPFLIGFVWIMTTEAGYFSLNKDYLSGLYPFVSVLYQVQHIDGMTALLYPGGHKLTY